MRLLPPAATVCLLAPLACAHAAAAGDLPAVYDTGRFEWTAGGPLLEARPAGTNRWVAVKDPAIVRDGGHWHLFCTLRGKPRTHAVGYYAFEDWPQLAGREPVILSCHPGYFCAPQVFRFAPQNRWYMVCQASDDAWDPKYRPAWSCTTNLAAPESWSPLQPFDVRKPAATKGWIDFWVVCDDAKAHLFFTSNDGRMWRAETPLDRFPAGWSEPVLALQGDIFEASHTYRLGKTGPWLTLVEAQGGHGWRYYKAYRADRLEGPWKPLAAEKEHAFASQANVQQPGGRWTDSVSHGELLRAGVDERFEVAPDRLRFLIQGVTDRDRAGKAYGEIPWRLGLLEMREAQ